MARFLGKLGKDWVKGKAKMGEGLNCGIFQETKGLWRELQPGGQSWVSRKVGQKQGTEMSGLMALSLLPPQPPRSTKNLRDLKSYFCQVWILVLPCSAQSPIPVSLPFLLTPAPSSEVFPQLYLILTSVFSKPHNQCPQDLSCSLTFNNLKPCETSTQTSLGMRAFPEKKEW